MIPEDFETFIADLEASVCEAEIDRDYDDAEQKEAMVAFYDRFNDLLHSAQWGNDSLVAIMAGHIHDWSKCKLCTILDENLESLFERLFRHFSDSLSEDVLQYMSENLSASRAVDWPDTRNDRLQVSFALHRVATPKMLRDSAWHFAQDEQWSVSEGDPLSRQDYLEIVQVLSRHPSSNKDIIREWLKSVHEELPNADHLGCSYVPGESCENCREILNLVFPG